MLDLHCRAPTKADASIALDIAETYALDDLSICAYRVICNGVGSVSEASALLLHRRGLSDSSRLRLNPCGKESGVREEFKDAVRAVALQLESLIVGNSMRNVIGKMTQLIDLISAKPMLSLRLQSP